MDETLKQKLIEFVTEGGSSDEMEIVEEGDWVSEDNDEYLDTIVKHQDRFYSVVQSRFCSNFKYYYNQVTNVYEVAPQEVTITHWKPV